MVHRFDEGFDVSLLPKHERRRNGGIGGGGGAGVDRDTGGVVAPVLEAAEAVEEDFQDVAALPADVEIQVGEDPAHDSLI